LNLNSAPWKLAEKALLLVGVLLLGTYVAALLHRAIGARFGLWQFQKAQTAATSLKSPDGSLNVSLWSDKRIQAYKDSLAQHFNPPVAVLRVSRLQLTVPVFEGTDDLTLNRGVGRIAGTAQPGEIGNLGIAGHRDGFFRVLKDIQIGDSIELLVNNRTLVYKVRSVEIVSPSNTEVLGSNGESEVTLVTCFPFYFVGSAPQRFIVHAFLADGQTSDGKESLLETGSR